MFGSFFRFDHLKAAVRTEARTGSAMAAYNRFLCFIVKIYRPHNTGRYAFPAAYAFRRFHQHSPALALFKGMAGAYFHARWFTAPKADDRNKPASHAACGPYFNRALPQGMILLIYRGADIHACETPKTFIHIFWMEYFWHFILPL